MTLRRFLILTACICSIFFIGLYVVLQGERSSVESHYVNIDEILKSYREGKSLTIFSKDRVKIYEKVYERTEQLPVEVPEDIYYMVKFAGENLFICDVPSSKDDIKLLEFHSIPKDGLDNCLVLLAAEKALARRSDKSYTKLILWKTASDIVKRYGEEGVLRAYMENTYMQNDIWGLEAAAKSYFEKSIRHLSVPEKAWLVSVLTLGHRPQDNKPAFTKRRYMLIYRLYVGGFIDHNTYMMSLKDVDYGIHQDINLYPEYTELIMNELKEKSIKTDRQLVVYSNIDTKTVQAAKDAIAKKLEQYPKGINATLAVVNYEKGGVEALAGNDRTVFRTMQMRRQIGSTFKPIVYLTAVTKGAMPNQLIRDKRYSYNLGNYVYSPANFEDYYMGTIPMRLGLVHSLNNATIRLAKITGLRSVGQMAVDLGMKARIKPYLAMPLGIFPITPLNLAKVYSTFGTYGIKNEIGFVNRIENGRGEEIYLRKEAPVRVSDERKTYQVLYMMKDVVRRGTARGSGLITGTAAKTGTTDEYRDAWTVAIFPPYAVVCWVGFDDHRSMGEKGTGGGLAAPIIAEFQKRVTSNLKKVDFNVPKGVVFRMVDAYTGKVTGKGCGSRKIYMEAFLEEETPEDCNRRVASGIIRNKEGS
ncbi:MAG: hypothetical protein C0602_05305 [Denitrovibrio sp.]|nr:MAG: hypothetical protein C0602_05305 [Denitrovibrio sp.]